MKGIDVSAYQHPNGAAIDYAAVKAAGYEFAYIQLTDSTFTQNQYAPQDAKGFLSAGLDIGPYHFFRPDDSFDEQVNDFTKLLLAIPGWSLPAMIDVETESVNGMEWTGQKAAEFLNNVVTAISGETAIGAGYYMNVTFVQDTGAPWGKPLWLADPSNVAPQIPRTFTQTGQSSVPGIVGTVDIDTWNVSPPVGGKVMQSPVFEFKSGQLDVVQVASGALWHKWNNGAGWSNEQVGANLATFTGQPQVFVSGGAAWITVEDTTGKVWTFVQTVTSSTWENSPLP